MSPEKSEIDTYQNQIKCPDCQKEYPLPQPGKYKCIECYCKFKVDDHSSITIIPFFDEMKLEPLLVMLLVLGVVLLVAVGDKFFSFYQRLNFFVLFVIVVYGVFKGIQYLCRRYHGVDRFFRKISRPRFISDDSSLINLD